MRLLTWLFTTAESLYYLAGFFVVVGGLLIFVGHLIHDYVMQSQIARPTRVDNGPIYVHVENLNLSIEMSREEAIEFLARREQRELPPGAQ